MRIRWVKVWVDAMATLTERFRDDEGRVDFEALGREEYAFRHALVTGDFSRSERARDLYDATINEITSRSEAGRKGAEARWNKNTAAATHREAVGESTTGCNHYDKEALDKPTISAKSTAGAGVNLDSTQTNKRPDASSGNAEGVNTNGSPITRNGSRAICTTATSGQTISATEALEGQRAWGNSLRVAKVSTPPVRSSGPAKRPHGEFGNVMLTDDEFAKLCEKCPDADSLITELDQYIESQGKAKKYKSHYATLLNWSRRKAQESKPKQGYKNINDINRENCEQIERDLRAMFHPEEVI